MNRMKFYKEMPNGKVAVLEVRVNQRLVWSPLRRAQRRASPSVAMDIAARGDFVCRRYFGEKRLATAKRERRLMPTQRTAIQQ